MSNRSNYSGPTPVIETARLRMRAHRVEDLDICAAMWADPEVVRYIGARPYLREEVWARLLRYAGHWALLRYGTGPLRKRRPERLPASWDSRTSNGTWNRPSAGCRSWAMRSPHERTAWAMRRKLLARPSPRVMRSSFRAGPPVSSIPTILCRFEWPKNAGTGSSSARRIRASPRSCWCWKDLSWSNLSGPRFVGAGAPARLGRAAPRAKSAS